MIQNINLTNVCNFKCITCPHAYHLGHYEDPTLKTDEFLKVPKGFMSWDILKRIPLNVETIVLQWIGESMMHPNFLKYYEYICRNSKATIFIDTNASFLNKKFNKRMVKITEKYKTKLIITFSLDSINQDTFSKIKRTNMNLNSILSNVKDFILHKSKNINSIVQALVLNENFNELTGFYQYWKDFFDRNNLRFKIIYSLGKQEDDIRNYIFFRTVSPESVGKPLIEKFKKVFKP